MMSADFHNSILNLLERVGRCFESVGIDLFGCCRFQDTLPLLDCRAKNRLPANPKTIIMCAFPYLVKENAETKRNLSYYACVKDYHIVAKNILENVCQQLRGIFQDNSFEWFADNSPIREVNAGVISGIGVLGDNGLLITKKYGSYVFLGEIVTDLILPYSTNLNTECLHCGLCKKKCPAKALDNEHINTDICLSAVTQKKKALSLEEERLIKENSIAWGCDHCQEVCPLNKNVSETPIKEFILSAEHFITSEQVPQKITDRAYAWRGEKVITRNLKLLE